MSRADPARVFAALGDRTRLTLMARISRGEGASIATLAVDTGITRQAVAKHLRVLEDAGLVAHVREGRESRFACRPAELAAARAWLEEVGAAWDAALGQLKRFVEDQPSS